MSCTGAKLPLGGVAAFPVLPRSDGVGGALAVAAVAVHISAIRYL